MMSTYLSKILFFTKKIIVLFTVFATLSANMSFALTPVSLSNQDYFKITTSAGKDMEIDLSTVQINKDVVTFSTKHKIDNYYINRISINVQDRTFKKLKQDIYKSNDLLKSVTYPKTDEFKPIKEDSLMAELYDVAVVLKNSSETFSENPKVWERYFNKVANKAYIKYHPNALRWKHLLNTEFKNNYIVVMLDRKGNILSYQYKNTRYPAYKKFDAKYNEHVSKIVKNARFPKLPKEYKGDKIIMRFYFGFDTNASDSSYRQCYDNNGTGVVMLEKNSSPLFTLPIFVLSLAKITANIGMSAATIPLWVFKTDVAENLFTSIWAEL